MSRAAAITRSFALSRPRERGGVRSGIPVPAGRARERVRVRVEASVLVSRGSDPRAPRHEDAHASSYTDTDTSTDTLDTTTTTHTGGGANDRKNVLPRTPRRNPCRGRGGIVLGTSNDLASSPVGTVECRAADRNNAGNEAELSPCLCPRLRARRGGVRASGRWWAAAGAAGGGRAGAAGRSAGRRARWPTCRRRGCGG